MARVIFAAANPGESAITMIMATKGDGGVRSEKVVSSKSLWRGFSQKNCGSIPQSKHMHVGSSWKFNIFPGKCGEQPFCPGPAIKKRRVQGVYSVFAPRRSES